MPFTKVGKDDYTSPTGRHFNTAQVKLYYANGGHFPGEKTVNKGHRSKEASFAAGGPVLGRTRDFMKIPDEFRDPDEGEQGDSADEDQLYAKSGEGSGKGFVKPPAAAGKSLKPIKPRS